MFPNFKDTSPIRLYGKRVKRWYINLKTTDIM